MKAVALLERLQLSLLRTIGMVRDGEADARMGLAHWPGTVLAISCKMPRNAGRIRFRAKLLQPASPAKGGSWSFLTLPKAASARLPSRGLTTIEGTINGFPIRATLKPDGQKSHWLKVSGKLREAARSVVGANVFLDIALAKEEPEPTVPADLRNALMNAPKAHSVWSDITPIARRDWIQWIVSTKRPETRARRVVKACAMLADGKRRVCCFDRSGFYSKSLSAPLVASRTGTRVSR